MTDLICIVNQKGGVGKTTTTVNLGAALATEGKRVLLVDMDPQSNLTTHLGLGGDDTHNPNPVESVPVPEFTVYDVLKGTKKLSEVIINRSSNLDVVPASLFLSAADLEMGGMIGRELILKKALIEVRDDYDIVLVDCPPSLGLLSLNALAAVKKVIIPVQSEYLALHGVRQLLDTIEQVSGVYNPELEVGGVLISMYDSRKKLSKAVVDAVGSYFGDLVFSTIVRSNVALAEAPASGQSIFEYAPSSAGAQDYMSLAKEILYGPQEVESSK